MLKATFLTQVIAWIAHYFGISFNFLNENILDLISFKIDLKGTKWKYPITEFFYDKKSHKEFGLKYKSNESSHIEYYPLIEKSYFFIYNKVLFYYSTKSITVERDTHSEIKEFSYLRIFSKDIKKLDSFVKEYDSWRSNKFKEEKLNKKKTLLIFVISISLILIV